MLRLWMLLFWSQEKPIMQREYARSCSDEPWPTFMVKNKHCLDDTEEDTVYKPNVKHQVPFIDIPEKLTTTERRVDKSSTNRKKCQNYGKTG